MRLRYSCLGALAALVLGLLGAPALARDEVGIFFDQVGERNCVQADAYSTLNAYLLLLDPSAGGGVLGWECSLEIEEAMLVGVTLAGQAINIATGDEEFVVGLSHPLPASSAVGLAQLQILVLGTDPVGMYIHPTATPGIPDTPCYADGSDSSHLVPMTPHGLGGSQDLVAGVNRLDCVPEQSTWGRVKIVYD